MDEIRLYQHAKRPDWGLAMVVDFSNDRRTFLFADGQRRTFLNEYAQLMLVAQPEEGAAEEARKYFAKHSPRISFEGIAVKKPATKRKPKAPAKAKTKAE